MLTWEQIAVDTYRLKVIGGWIVKTLQFGMNGNCMHTVFIPDATHRWEIN